MIDNDLLLEVPSGWRSLAKDTIDKLRDRFPGITIDQTKEKFGALRIYYTLTEMDNDKWDDAYNITLEAEKASTKICQDCGKPGVRKSNKGWLATLCPEHQPEEFDETEIQRLIEDQEY